MMCLDEELVKICLDLEEQRKEREKKKREADSDDLLENVYMLLSDETVMMS